MIPKGQTYLKRLAVLHRQLRPKTYVEIGIGKGDSLVLAYPETDVVGIDPELKPVRREARLYGLTSDDFFACHDLGAILGRPVDFAFIDGMHLFEFALRDFMNIERFCIDESLVVVHDCLPRHKEITVRDERDHPLGWAGDVWKLPLCLAEYRPDLHLEMNDVHPTGLLLVRNLDRDSRVLHEHYDEICERYVPLDYPGPVSLLSEPPG